METKNESRKSLGELVKRTVAETAKYLGLELEEYIRCVEEQYKVRIDDVKYVYTIEGERMYCFADAVEIGNGKYIIQGETSLFKGEYTYKEMIKILLGCCTYYH